VRHVRRLVLFVLVASVATVFGDLSSPTAGSAVQWAPAATAPVHPGVQTFTEGAQCTANFVFSDGGDVFIGQAAHCSGTGGATETDGCLAQSLPLGTPVEVTGATRPGTLVYNSWIEMQQNGETNADACAYNDFALIKLDPADHSRVNPSVPFFGGPVALGAPAATGASVYSYGNSSLRFGITQLSPKYGISLGNAGGGWSTKAYTVTPGVPGDSGSGMLDAQGRAIGVLSTLEAAPMPAANNYGDLARELAYMHAHAGFGGVQLVPGTEAFRVPLTPLGG
jgi:hypothetical protein